MLYIFYNVGKIPAIMAGPTCKPTQEAAAENPSNVILVFILYYILDFILTCIIFLV